MKKYTAKFGPSSDTLETRQVYEFSDFVGTWSGNITNDQTWAFDYPITIEIQGNNEYQVIHNPGSQLVSDLYPGTEEVYYNVTTNILSFQWVQYYHYSCGGACYSSVPFEVIEYESNELTLYYNNGSGPAPQAYSMFLSQDQGECTDGEINNDNPCNPMECYGGQWFEIIIDCAENEGVPCVGGHYEPAAEGECCSVCVSDPECTDGEINNDNPCNPMECYGGQWFELIIDCAENEGVPCVGGHYEPAAEGECCSVCVSDPECTDGEINNDNPCNPMECYGGQWFEIIIDCAEWFGVPCDGGLYVPPPEDVCCSSCVLFGDVNGDSNINVIDVVETVNLILGAEYSGIADINQDNSVDVADVVQLVSIILDGSLEANDLSGFDVF